MHVMGNTVWTADVYMDLRATGENEWEYMSFARDVVFLVTDGRVVGGCRVMTLDHDVAC